MSALTDATDIELTHAARFEPLEPDRAERWSAFPSVEGGPYWAHKVGFELVALRADYAAIALRIRDDHRQAAGVVHGGVLASMLDTVVVPAVGGAYAERVAFTTVDMTIQFLGAVAGGVVVAEGWVVQRGRSIAFCQAEARNDGRLVATGLLTYKVSPDRVVETSY
jgi:uncharacterized protein (TIGR00369 family)